MNDLPAAAALLAIARDALNTEVRPHLQGEARYVAGRIANAMAIAAREIEAGDAPARAALERLDRLHRTAPRALHGAELLAALAAHERRLAADIRAGRYDGDDERRRALLEHLRQDVETRLRISNPKALNE